MGLTAPSLKFILLLNKKYKFKGPLLTYGNQDIYADLKTIKKWTKEYKLPNISSKKYYKSSSLDLKQINPESKNFVHAKTFFKQIGIKESNYYDVDKFDFDKPKIIHDLEKPFDKKYNNFFNLIIDSGTMEHIFDIKSVMVNTVKITKLGGYVLYMIPANNFLNHGFYQISPTFFYDFYTANGFKIIESYITEAKPTCIRFHKYNQKLTNETFFNPFSRLGSVFLVKKIKNIKNIKSPTQFAYSNVIDSIQKKKQIKHFDKFTNKLRRMVPFKYHGLFYIPWIIYKIISTKKNYFDLSFK
ncbi:MAG: hypothetical protein WC720_02900 [Candidatus Shapirobacteria bacterium]|jgi:hypothetical protein